MKSMRWRKSLLTERKRGGRDRERAYEVDAMEETTVDRERKKKEGEGKGV